MRKTARDVTAGTGSPNTGSNPATAGPDLATGDGLVDAHKAVLLAKVRCLGPVRGIRQPGPEPVRTIEPVPEPIRSITPRDPGPILPSPVPPQPGPIGPTGFAGSSLESTSLQSQKASEAQPVPLSPDDIQSLENMVIKGEIKLD